MIIDTWVAIGRSQCSALVVLPLNYSPWISISPDLSSKGTNRMDSQTPRARRVVLFRQLRESLSFQASQCCCCNDLTHSLARPGNRMLICAFHSKGNEKMHWRGSLSFMWKGTWTVKVFKLIKKRLFGAWWQQFLWAWMVRTEWEEKRYSLTSAILPSPMVGVLASQHHILTLGGGSTLSRDGTWPLSCIQPLIGLFP